MSTGDQPLATARPQGGSGPRASVPADASPSVPDTEAPAWLGGGTSSAAGSAGADPSPPAPSTPSAPWAEAPHGRPPSVPGAPVAARAPMSDERSPCSSNPPGPPAGTPESPYTGFGSTMDGQPAYGPGANPVYGLESPAPGEQPYGSPGPRGGWSGPGGAGYNGAPAPGEHPWQGGTAQQPAHRAPVSEQSGFAGYRDPHGFTQPPTHAPGGEPLMPGERRDPRVFAQPEQQSPQPEGAAPAWNTGVPPGVPAPPAQGAPPVTGSAWGATQGHQPPTGHQPSLDDVPLRRAKKSPGSGWRKAVHHMSGGAINPGMSAEERRLQELVARIRQPVRGDYRIAVLSLKGGVGKTTTTMGLGSIFASVRGDRVIAVDANPDFGTLSQRVSLQTRSTVRDLLLDPSIDRYSDVRRHTSQATSRLEVLASERDPAASESFNDEEYRAVARILQRFYNIILTDCGTGLMHSAMTGVLDLAHSLVLVSSAAIDGARSAAATLDWLSLHGHDHLVRNAVVVINLPREGSPNVGVQQLREYFLARCRAVHIIPYDGHLSEGAEIDLHRLSKQAKRAYVELAATVADGFGVDHRRFHH